MNCAWAILVAGLAQGYCVAIMRLATRARGAIVKSLLAMHRLVDAVMRIAWAGGIADRARKLLDQRHILEVAVELFGLEAQGRKFR